VFNRNLSIEPKISIHLIMKAIGLAKSAPSPK
jgi:hypothetical protein